MAASRSCVASMGNAMIKPLRISEVVLEMETLGDLVQAYYVPATGRIEGSTTEMMSLVEDLRGEDELEDLPEWQRDEVARLKPLLEGQSELIELPAPSSTEEFVWMEKFANTVEDKRYQKRFLRVLEGDSPFRRFKDLIYEYELARNWYVFRDEQLWNAARGWLADNNIPFIDEAFPGGSWRTRLESDNFIPPKQPSRMRGAPTPEIEPQPEASSSKAVVTITYCTQCRWMLRAAWMAQELLTTFESEIGGVTLVPGKGGVFEISVSDEQLWSRKENGGFPEIAALKRLVRDHVAPGKDLGHAEVRPKP